MEFLGVAFGWLIFSIVAGIIAGARGRSGFGYFLLSIVLTPLIGIILAAALPNLNVTKDPDAPTSETHVRCPDCRELVRIDATKCKHCGVALTPQPIDEYQIKRREAKENLLSFGKVLLWLIVIFLFFKFLYALATVGMVTG